MAKTSDLNSPEQSVSHKPVQVAPNADTNGSTNHALFNNNWYNPGPRWKIILWFLVGNASLNTYLPIPMSIKRGILRLFGARLGHSVVIKPAVNIKYPWFLQIGDHVWIGEKAWIDNLSPVVIGNHVTLSQGSLLLTGNHDYRRSAFDLTTKPITIEDGVWVGAKSIVCSGVVCHSHAVLAVNSVATKSLNAYGIYQGNPAIWVRERKIGS